MGFLVGLSAPHTSNTTYPTLSHKTLFNIALLYCFTWTKPKYMVTLGYYFERILSFRRSTLVPHPHYNLNISSWFLDFALATKNPLHPTSSFEHFFSFWGHTQCAQHLLLALSSSVTSSGAQGQNGLPGIVTRFTWCKANTLLLYFFFHKLLCNVFVKRSFNKIQTVLWQCIKCSKLHFINIIYSVSPGTRFLIFWRRKKFHLNVILRSFIPKQGAIMVHWWRQIKSTQIRKLHENSNPWNFCQQSARYEPLVCRLYEEGGIDTNQPSCT